MRTLARDALSIGAAAALLVGCGSQPPIGAPGTMPKTLPIRATSSYKALYLFGPQIQGTHPFAGLLDVNGTLYGTTYAGGLSYGTIYSVTTSGAHKLLYRFHGGTDGASPRAGLTDVSGMLYGTTDGGGSSKQGTVFTVTTAGVEKVLYSFKGGSDGANPDSALTNVNGTLYGTTSQGGSECYAPGCGTVFSLTTSGKEKVLYSFTGRPDGENPFAELIDVKGVLYGTTASGGSKGAGSVYSITPAGAEKVLYSFQGGSDGWEPLAGLVDLNGTLYGTTSGGGTGCYSYAGCGTVFSVSISGNEKLLYRFGGGTDGADPVADLIAVNGVLYGTASGGARQDGCFGSCGTVYSITTDGKETVLYRFAGGLDGDYPLAPLTNVNGTLYGTTYHGGRRDICCRAYGWGTVFTLTP